MLLAIEQGNTNTLFAVHDGKSWIVQWRAGTDPLRTADEYAVWLSQLLSMNGLTVEAMDACIISSVVPQSLFSLRNLARRYLHLEPMVIGENVDLGVPVRIDKPSEAGADRLVNAVGAHVAYPGDLIVIDSGTATTFDVVADDGGFEGGVIAPGINLSMQALHEAAARLPRVAIRRPTGNRVIGADTVSADGAAYRLHREVWWIRPDEVVSVETLERFMPHPAGHRRDMIDVWFGDHCRHRGIDISCFELKTTMRFP